MFIDEKYIKNLLAETQNASDDDITEILNKSERFEGLSPKEVAILLNTRASAHVSRIFDIARKIKENIYGSRVVMFAPIYVSDYCVNSCAYCNFSACSSSHARKRRKLTQDELREEVRLLGLMGHKRLALEAGEDPQNCDIDYILECIRTIYDSKTADGDSDIRRINVNIAATTVEDYQKLKSVGIGTYILFQETYHRDSYEKYHLSGPKSDYEYHLTAFDRSMEAGIDDVGGGVLFGLYDADFEVLGLMLHNQHLEKTYGVGFHTISMPRLKNIDRNDSDVMREYPYILSDDDFLRICAILRLALPFTGMIISTRENPEMRKKLIATGISQLSAGSNVEVGGYARASNKQNKQLEQFQLEDNRDAADVIAWLSSEGLIPSFCTACYRNERVGERFMKLAKWGEIKNVCLPNALMTLCEYAQDYSGENSDSIREAAQRVCDTQLMNITSHDMREYTALAIEKIKNGERDLYV